MRRGSQAGFTLIEVVIGAAIMATLMGALFLSQRSTMRLSSGTASAGLLEEKALGAVERVASELRWVDTGSFLITQENGSDRLDLQMPTGFAAGATTWSTNITYRVEPSAVDANGDGVMDEGRLVRIQDGITRALCDYVALGGFSASMTDNNVQLQLILTKRDGTSNALLTTNAQTSASVRN